MTWHETIDYIRTKPEFKELVDTAYFNADLSLNIQNFALSDEYNNTLKYIKQFAPNAKRILDIGAGNGISSINFANLGYDVTVIEPDPSPSVGAGAIKKLIEMHQLKNVKVYECFAEEINFESNTFDIVYIRQAVHHANNLKSFIKEAARVLKKDGLMLTIRDHVIRDEQDKEEFFKIHPLHKFYGGENAYKASEYREAFEQNGLSIIKELKYFDDPINYFPHNEASIKELRVTLYNNLNKSFKSKFGILSKLPFVLGLYKLKNGFSGDGTDYFEKMIPGRMYSYILKKR